MSSISKEQKFSVVNAVKPTKKHKTSIYSYNIRKKRCRSNIFKKSKSKLVSSEKTISDNVKKANEIVTLLEPHILDKWKTFSEYENYKNCTIKCLPSSLIEVELLKWAFDLCKSNVKKMYEETQGWDEKAKYSEMTDEAARYIILNNCDTNKPIAFSHFRFDMDYGEEVLYCYELHVIEEEQGKGIGRCLLNILEFLAHTYQMSKVILTVFKANEDAIRFYKKCKYEEDYTCPKDAGYLIISKYIT